MASPAVPARGGPRRRETRIHVRTGPEVLTGLRGCRAAWLPARGTRLGAHKRAKRNDLMIFGAHVIVYSTDATADRAFFRDVLGWASVDAGHDWLIFALPPAEVAVHPAEANAGHELFLMCDDLAAEMAALGGKGVPCSEVEEARWGSVTKIQLPGGGEVGLYQPKHPLALDPAPRSA